MYLLIKDQSSSIVLSFLYLEVDHTRKLKVQCKKDNYLQLPECALYRLCHDAITY